MDTDWPSLATTNLETLQRWNQETPDANCAAVAKAELGGHLFFEIDDPSIPSQIEQETGQKLPRTYRVRSRPGRGHFYFKQTPASIALGNVAQGNTLKGNFSVRADAAYVVAANSLHPNSGLPYEVVSTAEIVECPDWLVEWFKTQKSNSSTPKEIVRDVNNLIPHGMIHDQLVIQAGKLVHMGMPYEALPDALVAWAHGNCAPPLDEEHIRQIARSTDGWKRGNPAEEIVLVGGKPAGQSTITVEDPEIDSIALKPVPYPKWPGEWVMRGTSIYEGFVRPFVEENSRYPEFLWIPAMTILLNYLGTKVTVERKNLIPSIFTVLIGRRGKVLKSSSVEDAIKYFEYCGVAGHSEPTLNNANGRSLIFTPGSAEGFGKEMMRTNCKNGIWYFDELSTLVNKASIESSTIVSNMLLLYESAKFQNIIKNTKDSYSLLPGSYCASFLACCTDKNFTINWSKLAGQSTGLTDRFLFILQPEVLKPLTPYIHVNTQEGSLKTRQLIDKALEQKVYKIDDSSPLSKFTAENEDSNRSEIRAEKLALGIAVDMGLDSIDEESIERALAIIAYEQAVKAYLKTYEASTREGAIQLEVLHQLRKAGGRMSIRDLYRVVHPERLGTSLWNSVYTGLIKSGWCKESGGGVKGAPKEIILLRIPEEDD